MRSMCLYKTIFICFAKKAPTFLKSLSPCTILYCLRVGVLALQAYLQQVLFIELSAHEALSSGKTYWRLYPMI